MVFGDQGLIRNVQQLKLFDALLPPNVVLMDGKMDVPQDLGDVDSTTGNRNTKSDFPRFDFERVNSLIQIESWEELRKCVAEFHSTEKDVQFAIDSELNAIGYIEQKKYAAALSALKQIPPLIEENNQELLSHIKALELHVETCPHVFSQDVVVGLISSNNLIGLKSYLELFLINNPIEDETKHPGLWLTFFELEMLSFFERNEVDLAVESFNTNSDSLKSIGNDCVLCPVDLDARIQRVKTNLSKREFYTNQKQKTTTALLDYARLYFRDMFWPDLHNDDSWTQFVRKEAGIISCLACSWVADKYGENNFKKHFCPPENSRVNRCSSITFHLAKRARQVFNITGQFSYADFLTVYKKGKKCAVRTVKHANNESSLSSCEKSAKRARVESGTSPSSKSHKRSRTEGTSASSSASSPDGKSRDIVELITVGSETSASGILALLLKLNMDLKDAAKSEVQQLCDEQGDIIYKLSRKAKVRMELLLDLSKLEEVNSKFGEVMSDQSSNFELKILDIVDLTYKLRVFCMANSVGEVGQSKGYAVHHFVGKLIQSIFQITGLIGKDPDLPEYSTMKDICRDLNKAAARVMKLYEEKNLIASALHQWAMEVASVRKQFIPLTGSISNLHLLLLDIDEAIYKICRLCLKSNGIEESY